MTRFSGNTQHQVTAVMSGRVSDLQTRVDMKPVAEAIKSLKPADLSAVVAAIKAIDIDVETPDTRRELMALAQAMQGVGQAVGNIQTGVDLKPLVAAVEANTAALNQVIRGSAALKASVDGVADALARPKTVTRDRNGNIESIE